jgi:hypothetical protein
MVTYLRRNVTIVRGVSCHLLGSQISQVTKIRFQLQVESYISNWRFSKLRHFSKLCFPPTLMPWPMTRTCSLWIRSAFTCIINMQMIRQMLQCRKTSSLLERAFLIDRVLHPHKSRFMGIAQKRRYLLQMSR